MIVLPDGWGVSGPSMSVDWFARAVVLEIAIAAEALGTFPLVARGAVPVDSLASRVGIPSRPDRVRRAIGEAFAAGLLTRAGEATRVEMFLRVEAHEIREVARTCSVKKRGKAGSAARAVTGASGARSVRLSLTSEDVVVTVARGETPASVSERSKIESADPPPLTPPHPPNTPPEHTPQAGTAGNSTNPGGRPKAPTPEELSVFAAWVDVFGKQRGRVKLDAHRLRAIRRAMRNGADGLGFTAADLIGAVRGYARDPWRGELPVRHELATLIRNAGQVETGLALLGHVGPVRSGNREEPPDEIDVARAEAARRMPIRATPRPGPAAAPPSPSVADDDDGEIPS